MIQQQPFVTVLNIPSNTTTPVLAYFFACVMSLRQPWEKSFFHIHLQPCLGTKDTGPAKLDVTGILHMGRWA